MISTMLVLSVLLGLVPLAGVAWTAANGTITTVDGLFMSLILLTLSGILFLNAYLEMRSQILQKKAAAPPPRKTS
jgi:hypothetical protein